MGPLAGTYADQSTHGTAIPASMLEECMHAQTVSRLANALARCQLSLWISL
jgi:hypothetical protein